MAIFSGIDISLDVTSQQLDWPYDIWVCLKMGYTHGTFRN